MEWSGSRNVIDRVCSSTVAASWNVDSVLPRVGGGLPGIPFDDHDVSLYARLSGLENTGVQLRGPRLGWRCADLVSIWSFDRARATGALFTS